MTPKSQTRNEKKWSVQVITQVPNPDEEDGNLAHEMFCADIDKLNGTPTFRPFRDLKRRNAKGGFIIPVNLEVFSLGEIIIVDETEREIGGIGRKACKWYVEYKMFASDEMGKAIKLSQALLKKALKRPKP